MSNDWTQTSAESDGSSLPRLFLESGGVIKATQALLNADLTFADGTPAAVYADDELNGFYVKNGDTGTGSWSFLWNIQNASDIAAIAAQVAADAATATASRWKTARSLTSLKALPGASFQNGDLIFLSGPISTTIGGGGEYEWFSASTATPDDVYVVKLDDTTTGRLLKRPKQILDPRDWSGYMDGAHASADTTAINAALVYGASTGLPVLMPSATTVSGQIIVPLNGTLQTSGPLTSSFSGGSAVVFGDPSVLSQWENPNHSYVRVVRATIDYTDANAGVELLNTRQLALDFYADNFHTGVRIHGKNGLSSHWNEVLGHRTRLAKRGLHIFVEDTNASCNQNRVALMRWGTTITSSDDIYGVHIENNSSHTVNGSTIYSDCESLNPGAGDVIAFYGESTLTSPLTNVAQLNKFMGRSENPDFLLGGDKTFSYNEFSLENYDQSTYSTTDRIKPKTANDFTGLVLNDVRWADPLSRPWQRPIAKVTRGMMTTRSNSGTKLQAPARCVFFNATPTLTKEAASWTVNADTFTGSSTSTILGCAFDVTGVTIDLWRWLSVKLTHAGAGGGAIYMVCLKADFTLAGDSVNNGTIYSSLPWNGSIYVTSGTSSSEMANAINDHFTIGYGRSPVAYVLIGFAKKTNNVSLKSFEIFCPWQASVKLVTDPATLTSIGGSIAVADTDDVWSLGIPNDTTFPRRAVVFNGNFTGAEQIPGWYPDTSSNWYEMAPAGALTGAATAVTAHAGGGQASATALTKKLNRLSTVASAGDSAALPAAVAGHECIILNDTATSAQIFGAGTDTINGVATATGIALAGGAKATFYCDTAGPAGKWFTILSA